MIGRAGNLKRSRFALVLPLLGANRIRIKVGWPIRCARTDRIHYSWFTYSAAR